MFKRRFGWGIAIPVALMSVTALAVTSIPASAATSGQIKHASSDFCLTNGGSTANSAPITQYTCNGSSNQTWTIQGASFKNNTSRKCLTTGGSPANSAPITQYTCNGSSNQQWAWSQFSNGSWEIVNVGTGKCISNGGSTANSAPITQYTCNGSSNQQWTSPLFPS